MDIQEAVKTMRALANAIDPESGQRREADSIYLRPPTIKALNDQIWEELRAGIDFPGNR
jgi:hypothetical protein